MKLKTMESSGQSSVSMPEILTPREVAKILKISYENVLQLIRYNQLKALKIGRQYRVKSVDLSEFLNNSSLAEL